MPGEQVLVRVCFPTPGPHDLSDPVDSQGPHCPQSPYFLGVPIKKGNICLLAVNQNELYE